MKKKIAFVTPIYLPAPLYGSDNAVRILAEDFAAAGHDVTVVTSDALTPRYWYDPLFGKKTSDIRDTFNGVHVIRLPSQQWITSAAFIIERVFGHLLPTSIRNTMRILSSGPSLGGLLNVFKKEQFDVVHASPFPLEINQQVLECVEHLDKKPLIILTPFFHAGVEAYHNQKLGTMLEKSSRIHVISNAEKKQIEEYFPVAQGKTSVIPLYIRTPTMHAAETLKHEVLRFKKQYGIEHRKIILFAGLKGTLKGALTTLTAVKNLYAHDKRILLIAIGHNTSEWSEALKRSDVSAYVLDFGYIDEFTKEIVFASCDVFCMPSISETFGYVYLEAWHKKKPVIASDIPAMQELVLGNKGGILVKFGSPGDIQASIERLIQRPALSIRLGESGYNALVKKYDMTSVFALYRKMFIDDGLET